MVTLRPRGTPDVAALSSGAAGFDDVWSTLNRTALWIAAILGPPAVLAYLVALSVTGHAALTVLVAAGIGVSVASAWNLRRRHYSIASVLVFGSIGVVAGGVAAAPVVRGALWSALVAFAVTAALVLPTSESRRTIAFIGALSATPAAWPAFGLASTSEAVFMIAVAGGAMFFGVLAVSMARKALEASEVSRIAIFRRVPVGLFRASPDGRFLDANPAMLEILGHDTDSDVASLSLPELYADPREGREYLKRLVFERGPQRFAVQMAKVDGTPIWVRGQVQAIAGPDGSVGYFEGTIEDITQRHEAEQASRRHEQRFRTLFDSAPVALAEEDFSFVVERLDELRSIGVSDLAKHLDRNPSESADLIRRVQVIDVNPAAVELLGAATKQEAIDVLRNPPADLRPAYELRFHSLWNDRERGDVEVKMARPDGVEQYLHIHWAMPREASSIDPSRVVMAAVNVTALKAAERGLAALVQSKDELVASVSHELRTPITTIMGMSLELRDNAHLLEPAERTEFVGLIADQSRELSNIVEDLLVAARVDQDRLIVRPESVDLTREVPRIVSSTMTRRPAAVRVDGDALVWCDPLRFRQILRNLLTNADRYGGPNVSVEVTGNGGHVRIRVCDDGEGVVAHEREAIFEPYHRAQESGLPGAIGLGLPVSRRLARLMGGDLIYAFDEGLTVFEITLPASTASLPVG